MKSKTLARIGFPESRESRLVLVLATILAAITLTGVITDNFQLSFLGLIFFPAGLTAFFQILDSLGDRILFLGWFAYLLLSGLIIRAQKRRTAIMLFVLLVLMLLANVRGCASQGHYTY